MEKESFAYQNKTRLFQKTHQLKKLDQFHVETSFCVNFYGNFLVFFFLNGLAFSKYLTKSFRGQLQVVRKLEVTVKAEPFKVSPQL